MNRTMLKSKIHGVRITGLDLYYEGSITVDADLLDAADILPGEQVHVLNLNNGSRLVTYTIAAPRGSGSAVLNGPASRHGAVGDPLIILAYGQYNTEETRALKIRVVAVDEKNRPQKPSLKSPS